jgi:hypothetical protein
MMETFDVLIVASAEAAVVTTQFFEWFSKFKPSVTSAEDADGWGSLSTNRTDKSVND